VNSLTLAWLRWVAYALLLTSIVPLALAISQLVKARRAPYYAMRLGALKRARRWALVTLLFLVLGIDMLVVPPRLLAPSPRPREPAPEPTTPTLTAMIVPTLHPTRAPTTTPTRRPTATAPFIPTPTAVVPPPESALTPLPSAVPAGKDARITIVTLAANRDENGQPVDPGAEFPPGDHRVYLFISYEGMADGVAWTFAICCGGESLDSVTQLWEWGAEGRTSLYYEPPAGYSPGVYEMRVFVQDRLQGVAQFVITEG
jgi:hypothetical protein